MDESRPWLAARVQRDEGEAARRGALQALLEWREARRQRMEFLSHQGRWILKEPALTPAEQREYEPLDKRFQEAEGNLVVASDNLAEVVDREAGGHHVVVGRLGQGKTLAMAKLAIEHGLEKDLRFTPEDFDAKRREVKP